MAARPFVIEGSAEEPDISKARAELKRKKGKRVQAYGKEERVSLRKNRRCECADNGSFVPVAEVDADVYAPLQRCRTLPHLASLSETDTLGCIQERSAREASMRPHTHTHTEQVPRQRVTALLEVQ